MAEHMRTGLVTDALTMAVAARGGDVAGVIAHADRGTQYTSNEYLDFCHRHQLRPSVGRTAVCPLTGQPCELPAARQRHIAVWMLDLQDVMRYRCERVER